MERNRIININLQEKKKKSAFSKILQIVLTFFKGNCDRTLRFTIRISLLASSNYQIVVCNLREQTQVLYICSSIILCL